MRGQERKKNRAEWEEVREREQAESRKPIEASTHKNEKMIMFMRSGATKFVAALRNPHYCTSWALGVAFEVLWGTSSHETSIVNPLVNQVRSWAYVWSGSFSLEDSKRSKGIVAGCKDRVSKKIGKNTTSAALVKTVHYPKFVAQFCFTTSTDF